MAIKCELVGLPLSVSKQRGTTGGPQATSGRRLLVTATAKLFVVTSYHQLIYFLTAKDLKRKSSLLHVQVPYIQ
jgi:hypothetical protein